MALDHSGIALPDPDSALHHLGNALPKGLGGADLAVLCHAVLSHLVLSQAVLCCAVLSRADLHLYPAVHAGLSHG